MLPEVVLIFACVNGQGCSESAAAYGNYAPEIVHELEVKANYYSRKWPRAYIIASYGASIARKHLEIAVTSRIRLKLGPESSITATIPF